MTLGCGTWKIFTKQKKMTKNNKKFEARMTLLIFTLFVPRKKKIRTN